MGLRQAFRNRKNRKAAKRAARVNQQFEDLANRLQQDFSKNAAGGPRFFEITGIRRVDAKTLPAYKRLHEICAAANAKIEYAARTNGTLYMEYTQYGLAINSSQPYSASPDAPKKPRYEQLKLF